MRISYEIVEFHIDSLVQDCDISHALAMEIPQSCTKPQICYHRADAGFAPSQWEMSLQSNVIAHWLGANLESALYQFAAKLVFIL